MNLIVDWEMYLHTPQPCQAEIAWQRGKGQAPAKAAPWSAVQAMGETIDASSKLLRRSRESRTKYKGEPVPRFRSLIPPSLSPYRRCRPLVCSDVSSTIR